MDKGLKLKDAARFLGLSLDALNKRITRESIATIKIPESDTSKRLVRGLSLETIVAMQKGKPSKGYFGHWETCLERKLNGYYSGKPVSQRHIDDLRYGMELFWKMLGQNPDVHAITAPNLRLAISTFKPSGPCATDGYSSRTKMIRSVRSLADYLFAEGLMGIEPITLIKAVKTHRNLPIRAPHLSPSQLVKLLRANGHSKGRSDYNRELTKTVILLYVNIGLRPSEALRLKISDVHLDDDTIFIENAKGGKNRYVAIFPESAKQLRVWIDEYLTEAAKEADRLICDEDGEPLSRRAIYQRVRKLMKHGAPKIDLHGLRRTFGTNQEFDGMPMSVLQAQLGHTTLEATGHYLPPSKLKNVRWVRENVLSVREKPSSTKRRKRSTESDIYDLF